MKNNMEALVQLPNPYRVHSMLDSFVMHKTMNQVHAISSPASLLRAIIIPFKIKAKIPSKAPNCSKFAMLFEAFCTVL